MNADYEGKDSGVGAKTSVLATLLLTPSLLRQLLLRVSLLWSKGGRGVKLKLLIAVVLLG